MELLVTHGQEHRRYQFDDLADLVFQVRLENNLLADGWALSEFQPERRRRSPQRAATDGRSAAAAKWPTQ